jgi:hypothetical protein
MMNPTVKIKIPKMKMIPNRIAIMMEMLFGNLKVFCIHKENGPIRKLKKKAIKKGIKTAFMALNILINTGDVRS